MFSRILSCFSIEAVWRELSSTILKLGFCHLSKMRGVGCVTERSRPSLQFYSLLNKPEQNGEFTGNFMPPDASSDWNLPFPLLENSRYTFHGRTGQNALYSLDPWGCIASLTDDYLYTVYHFCSLTSCTMPNIQQVLRMRLKIWVYKVKLGSCKVFACTIWEFS